MNIFAIIIAAAAGFGVGAVWYMKFADRWMAAVGLTEEDVNRKDPVPYVVAVVAALLAAVMMRYLFSGMGVNGMIGGLFTGFGIGAFIVAPWVILHYGFAGRPRDLWLIDGGHVIAAFSVMGFVLGLLL